MTRTLPAMFFCAALWVVALPARGRAVQAQQGLSNPEILVNTAQARYDAAVASHVAARDSLDAVNQLYTRALMTLEGSRASGDDGRRQAAYIAALEPGREMSQRLARLAEAEDSLVRAHDDLVQALWHWQGAILDSMESGEKGGNLESYREDYLLIEERITRLEAVDLPEAGRSLMSELEVVEDDPRDGPDEWRYKASLCRRLAQEADKLLDDMNSDLNALVVRQRQERQREDFLADTDRFGRIPFPPGVGRQTGEPPVADSASVAGAPQTIEERIADLRDQIAILEDFRTRIMERAEYFESLGGDPV